MLLRSLNRTLGQNFALQERVGALEKDKKKAQVGLLREIEGVEQDMVEDAD